MILKLATMLLALALAGCSVTKQPGAYGGVAADGVSTAVALSMPNIVEANPIGYLTIPLRIAAIEYAEKLPPVEGVPIIHAVKSVSWMAATSNVLVIAGAANPVALAAGAAVLAYTWHAGADEREYAAFCADWISQKAGNNCKPWVAK